MIVETYPALAATGLCRHAFLGRVPGLDVKTDRETALARLAAHHEEAHHRLGFAGMPLITAEQVHGNEVALLDAPCAAPLPGIDALITRQPGICLGIYVADCCAVYVVDPVRRAIGLAHSGKRGTELRILPAMLRKMEESFGTDPAQTVIALSPCIRPPQYEIDFAAGIIQQCRELGVTQIHDSGANTAAHPDRYYSYRMERGQTGRMLALLALNP